MPVAFAPRATASGMRQRCATCSPDHRWGQTREAILAMKELWTKDEAEFHGKYYNFPPVISFPKPLQQPHPPIYVGAMTAGNVFRRVVTYGNGWMPWLYTPEQIRDGRAMLDKLAREFGRDPRSIVVVAAPVAAEPDVIKARAAGIDDEVAGIDIPAERLVPSDGNEGYGLAAQLISA
jgi:alkanesulfonate monooxygenase SsuD/methylene tetrahydromethanopterin reductase-like flavin-dependent oxidoreductase (luciferase family)